MSDEGIRLVMRVLLVGFMIVAGAIVRTMVGPSRRRGQIMLAGTLGGIAFGVLVASPISQWLKADVSVLSVCFGIVLGWTVSWRFARLIPREAT
jgi:hypothetical protein